MYHNCVYFLVKIDSSISNLTGGNRHRYYTKGVEKKSEFKFNEHIWQSFSFIVTLIPLKTRVTTSSAGLEHHRHAANPGSLKALGLLHTR